MIVRALHESDVTVVAILDDNPKLWGADFSGVPIIGPLDPKKAHNSLPAVPAIGSNAARKAVSERLDREWLTVFTQTPTSI